MKSIHENKIPKKNTSVPFLALSPHLLSLVHLLVSVLFLFFLSSLPWVYLIDLFSPVTASALIGESTKVTSGTKDTGCRHQRLTRLASTHHHNQISRLFISDSTQTELFDRSPFDIPISHPIWKFSVSAVRST